MVLLLACGTQAQQKVPGYRGKKHSLFVNMFSNISFAEQYRTSQTKINFNTRFSAEYDLVVGRPLSLGLAFHSLKTGSDYLGGNPAQITHLEILGYGPGVYFKSHPFFKNGFISPLGAYVKGELLTLIYRARDPQGKLDGSGNPLMAGRFLALVPMLAIGNNHLFWDRVFLTYAFQFGYPIPKTITLSTDFPSEVDDISDKVRNRLFGHLGMNVKIGTGILLF